MQEPSRDEEAREITLGPDPLSEALRSDLRDRVERIIREELYAALGAGPYERTPERRQPTVRCNRSLGVISSSA